MQSIFNGLPQVLNQSMPCNRAAISLFRKSRDATKPADGFSSNSVSIEFNCPRVAGSLSIAGVAELFGWPKPKKRARNRNIHPSLQFFQSSVRQSQLPTL